MEKRPQWTWISGPLAGLAILQLLVLVLGGTGDAPSESNRITVGDTILNLEAVDQTGREVALDAGPPTVLLVFRSDCPHMGTVGDIWRDWLRSEHATFRTIAISDEPISVAWAHALSKEWQIDVWSVEATGTEGMAREVTRRTPWVFFLGPDGTVLAEGHGARLPALALSQASAPGVRGYP